MTARLRHSSTLLACFTVLALAGGLLAVPAAADHKLEKGVALPDGLPAPLRDHVGTQGVRVLGDAGSPYAEIWLHKALPVEAKPAAGEILNPGIPEGTFLGVWRFATAGSDFRGQAIKPGLYTMRYALMPVDGNHVGAASYRDFVLLVPASLDSNPAAPLKLEEVLALSRKASGTGHPGVLPIVSPEAAAETSLVKNSDGHWILNAKVPAKSGAGIVVAVTVVGKSDH